MQNGWIKLNRKFFKNPLWKEDRPLSKAEAWLYLLINARIEASTLVISNRRKDIDLRRGELIVSERKLAKQWIWSRGKVRNYLDFLKRHDMISRRSQAGYTIVCILNYEMYQGKRRTESKKEGEKSKGIPNEVRMSASERFKMRHGV